ncbi:MAG: hypothetical protein ACOVNY_11055 [Chitinophagaceae bacterium]
METEKQLSQQESLKLITEMIQKAKGSHFHENGTSAILWGAVVGFCGIMSFAQYTWQFSIGFDVWGLTFLALIPQIFIAVKEQKNKIVKTHEQTVLDAVWVVYGISIFAVIFYMNVVPNASIELLAKDHIQLLKKDTITGEIKPWKPFVLSASSILMIIYAFPTLVTGLAKKFQPMIIGGIVCYGLFIASLFTSSVFDALLSGLAGICNWLIPGIILRKRYLKTKRSLHV